MGHNAMQMSALLVHAENKWTLLFYNCNVKLSIRWSVAYFTPGSVHMQEAQSASLSHWDTARHVVPGSHSDFSFNEPHQYSFCP